MQKRIGQLCQILAQKSVLKGFTLERHWDLEISRNAVTHVMSISAWNRIEKCGHADICIYADKPHMFIWIVTSSLPPDQIKDIENVDCTNHECSSIWSDDLIHHNQPHSRCEPLSLSFPLKEFLETTTAHWFLSLDQQGKVAYTLNEVDYGLSDHHFK